MMSKDILAKGASQRMILAAFILLSSTREGARIATDALLSHQMCTCLPSNAPLKVSRSLISANLLLEDCELAYRLAPRPRRHVQWFVVPLLDRSAPLLAWGGTTQSSSPKVAALLDAAEIVDPDERYKQCFRLGGYVSGLSRTPPLLRSALYVEPYRVDYHRLMGGIQPNDRGPQSYPRIIGRGLRPYYYLLCGFTCVQNPCCRETIAVLYLSANADIVMTARCLSRFLLSNSIMDLRADS